MLAFQNRRLLYDFQKKIAVYIFKHSPQKIPKPEVIGYINFLKKNREANELSKKQIDKSIN